MSSRLAKPAAHPATIAAIPLFPPAYLSDPEELSFQYNELESVASDQEMDDAPPLPSKKRKVLGEASGNASKKSKTKAAEESGDDSSDDADDEAGEEPAAPTEPWLRWPLNPGETGRCWYCKWPTHSKSPKTAMANHKAQGFCPAFPMEWTCDGCGAKFTTKNAAIKHKCSKRDILPS